MKPDFEQAKEYVFSRLKNELAPHLSYHNLSHTKDDVLPAAIRLANLTNQMSSAHIGAETLLLLQTAAVYHDLGYIEQRVDHETISVRMASETLPRFGYNTTQIQAITASIMATRLPQTPTSLLGELLADADLDILGREDFLEGNRHLRLELEAHGIHHMDEEWYSSQLDLLEHHTYFTAAARSLRLAQKGENLEALRVLLRKCSS